MCIRDRKKPRVKNAATGRTTRADNNCMGRYSVAECITPRGAPSIPSRHQKYWYVGNVKWGGIASRFQTDSCRSAITVARLTKPPHFGPRYLFGPLAHWLVN